MEIIKAVIKATKPERGKPIFSSCYLSGKIRITPVPHQFNSVQSLSRVRLLATPWTAAHQAFLVITNSQSLLKLMSIELVTPPTISSSVVPFSSCLQSFPASGSFQMSQFFTSGGQSIEASASTSVLRMNNQD